MTTTTELPTKGEYNDAIDKLSDVFGDDEPSFLFSLIQTARDDETLHTTDNEIGGCVDDCAGCMAETIADAVTRAVNGEAD